MRSTFRRNFSKSFQLDKVCGGSDTYRRIMAYIYFKDGYAFATDAYIGARVPIVELIHDISKEETEFLNRRYIHKNIYKKILSYDLMSIQEDGILCTDIDSKTGVLFKFAVLDNEFPPIWTVLENAMKEPIEAVEKIAFDYKFLSDLCSGLGFGGTQSVLEFRTANRAIIVRSKDRDVLSLGLLMPVMLND